MTSKQDVDWNEIELLIQILSEKILKLSRIFSSITTLSRGGLVPARLLADSLGIKKIYVDKKNISSDSLFVDDIFDSGETLHKVILITDDPLKLVFATLFARREKKYPKNLLYAKTTKNDDYVVFPWDKLEFKRLEEQY